MSTVRLERHVAADPTSLALLLAGPAAYPLWPGVAAVEAAGDGGHGTVLRLTLPDGSAGEIPVRVTTRPPRRALFDRYVLRFTAASPGRSIDGVLTLEYADPEPDGGPPNATRAILETTLPETGRGEASTVTPDTMRAMGDGFLARLRRVGEERAQAA